MPEASMNMSLTDSRSVWRKMKTLKIGLVLVLGLSIVASEPVTKPPPKGIISNPCDHHQCMNGGTCEEDANDSDGYRCECNTGYTGYTDDRYIDTENPCQNGGSFVETSGEEESYKCDCPAGYPGSHCEGRSCTFEIKNDPACFLDTRGATKAWRRTNKQTSSRTGPQRAFEGQFYYYFDASNNAVGEEHVILDDGILFEDKVHCLSLYYHMKGRSMGTFAIYTLKTSYVEHFSISGNQGNRWYKLELDLPLDEDTHIAVKAVNGYSFESNIAIDDVTLMPKPCSD